MNQIEMGPEDYQVEGANDGSSFGGGWQPPQGGRPVIFAGRETFLDRIDIVIVFLAVFGVLYGLEMLLGGAGNRGVLIALGGNYGSFVERGEFWRLVTANFLHGGLAHILVNGYSFYILGRFVERVYGRSRLFLVFLCTAILASFVSWQANAHIVGMLSVGASGGIAGLLGLLTAFTLRYKEKLDPRFRSNFFSNLFFILGLNVFIALMDTRIDNWAHAGGFAAGFLAGWLVFVPAVLFQKHSTMPWLRWSVFGGIFVLFAAFSAQAFTFTFSSVMPERGPFRSALTADGGVHFAYPVFFEVFFGNEREEEIYITNQLNHELRFAFVNEEHVLLFTQELAHRGITLEEGQLNGQKTIRGSGIPTRFEISPGKYVSSEQELFFIAAPRGSAQAGSWAQIRLVKPGRRITPADRRLLDAFTRRIIFTIDGAI